MNYAQAKKQYPDITELLDNLQRIYSERKIPDTESPFLSSKRAVEELFNGEESSLVIGTEVGEWFSGPDEIARLLYWDLAEWGNVEFQFQENAVISILKDSGWVASHGTCSMRIEPIDLWQLFFDSILQQVEISSLTAERKAAEINKYKAQISAEIINGSGYCWPFRFTAIFEKTERGWRFGHMHFSFPSGLLPWFRTDSILPYPDKESHPFFKPIPGKKK